MKAPLTTFLTVVAFAAGWVSGLVWSNRQEAPSKVSRAAIAGSTKSEELRPSRMTRSNAESQARLHGKDETESFNPTDADGRLVDAQNRLNRARHELLRERGDLQHALDTQLTYENWAQNMDQVSSRALGWWDAQRDPAVRQAMRQVTRLLIVTEIAAMLDSPESSIWIDAWRTSGYASTDAGLSERIRWWDADFVGLPNFQTLPPPSILEKLVVPETRTAVLTELALPPDQIDLIDPSVLYYLQGAAQAGVLASASGAYYDLHSRESLEQLDADAERINLEAIESHADSARPERPAEQGAGGNGGRAR